MDEKPSPSSRLQGANTDALFSLDPYLLTDMGNSKRVSMEYARFAHDSRRGEGAPKATK